MNDKSTRHPETAIQPEVVSSISDALSRSAVCRRLPLVVRARLDEAIILRPKEFPTLEAIAAHFDLAKYRISPQALRAYARRLEDLARPAATRQLLAVVLGCLPARYRRRTLAGTEVLLISRVVQALSVGEDSSLSPADLARFGSLLAAMARPHTKNAAKRSQHKLVAGTFKEIQPEQLLRHASKAFSVDLSSALPGSHSAPARA